ncbi:NACHT domain-containing NTPase [Streptacidiphilus sp. MAP5-3]|uniref:NACHT domain-containing protein n=1 Tax=unclassified Streptacidiphilus TaxID=2643834 RepID=UPI003515FFCA
MEPAVATALGRVAVAAIQRTGAAVRSQQGIGFPEWEEDLDLFGGLVLQDANGEEIAILTQDQVMQIGDFLDLPSCIALTQFLLIFRLGIRNDNDAAPLAEDYKESFVSLAEDFCTEHGYNWGNLAEDIWNLLLQYMGTLYPSRSAVQFLSSDGLARMTSYIGVTAKIAGGVKPANVAFRDIVDITGDSRRYAEARMALHDIRDASASHYTELNLAHTLNYSEGFRFEYSDLYVSRTLRVQNEPEAIDDSFLSRPVTRPRCVVVGSPGVGKSTMVRHLAQQLSSSDEMHAEYAPIVIQCKEFAGADTSTFILEAMVRTLKEGLQLNNVDQRHVNDLATLGRLFVIFDGVDEIIDITRRRVFVSAIESFGRRYPLTSILVTARRVGYQKAPLDPKEFQVFALDDFSNAQVVEYSQKWFSVTKREEQECWNFLRETETIPDVRVNPLMLSLLCSLYRARGYIPQNRRDVYRSCADLLFQRWDAMRHIEQPTDHRQYGTRLMQELALFFRRSQNAQAGVEEPQLRKIIASFFTDTASVEEEEARRRAEDFLEFCADRAWLLSLQGASERGIRLFGFTHRTFMEYFAAEAIVRRARSLDDIVEEVTSAYERDASSVLADVIFQCADDKYDGGATEIIKALLERAKEIAGQQADKYIPLCLRLMNAVPIPSATSDLIFDAVFKYWAKCDVERTAVTSVALFELYRDPRSRLISSLGQNPERARLVLERWARFYLRGEQGHFDPSWGTQLLEVARSFDPDLADDGALKGFLLDQGILSFTIEGVDDCWPVYVRAFGDWVPGPVALDLEDSIWTHDGNEFTYGHLVAQWVAHVREYETDPSPEAIDDLLSFIMARRSEITYAEIAAAPHGAELQELLLWCFCIIVEATSTFRPTIEFFDGAYGIEWFDRAVTLRFESTSPSKRLTKDAEALVAEVRGPDWLADWCAGAIDLCADDDLL